MDLISVVPYKYFFHKLQQLSNVLSDSTRGKCRCMTPSSVLLAVNQLTASFFQVTSPGHEHGFEEQPGAHPAAQDQGRGGEQEVGLAQIRFLTF